MSPTCNFLNDTAPIMAGISVSGDVSVMLCGCFAASGCGHVVTIEETMNSALYQNIFKDIFNIFLVTCPWAEAEAQLGYLARQ